MAGRDEQLLSGIPALQVGAQNSINSPNPTPAPYFPIQQHQHQNIHQIQQKPFYQTSPSQILPINSGQAPGHQNSQLYLPHMNPSQYRQISPQHIAPGSSVTSSGFQIRTPMSVIHGPSQVQPGHFIRMPDGKMGKVISTDRNLTQEWLQLKSFNFLEND